MAALTQVTPLKENTGRHGRNKAGASNIYVGALLGINGAGFVVPFATGFKFCGHAIESVLNAAGAAGDKWVSYLRGESGSYFVTSPAIAGKTVANIGERVWAVTDNPGDLTMTDPGTTKTATDLVGFLHAITDTGEFIIRFVPREVTS